MTMAYPIEGMFGQLLGRLEAIDNNFDDLSEKELRKRWNAAQALLQEIWAKIERENIDPARCEDDLSRAHSMVEDLDLRIDTRPRWGWLRSIFSYVLDLIDIILQWADRYVPIGLVRVPRLTHKKADD